MKTKLFERSAVTQILVDVLVRVGKGELITYGDLHAATGRHPQKEAKGHLRRARYILKHEHGYVFGCEAKIGLYRKTDSEIAETEGADGLRRISSEARRRMRSLECADTSHLDRDQIQGMHVHMATLGAVRLF